MMRLLLLCLLTSAILRAGGANDQLDKPTGEQLAARLRALEPAQQLDVRGVLEHRDARGKRTRTPVRLHTRFLSEGAWENVYETLSADGSTRERLTVRHHPQEPNQYRLYLASDTNSGDHLIAPNEIHRAFGDSDFSFLDLGLDFLHWPTQTILPIRNAMRKGQSCYVLESRPNPDKATPYGRVVSWIDRDTGGIILAEAFDHGNQLLKHFSIGSIARINGRWELRDMEIRNQSADTKTRLEFRYESE